MDKFERIYRSSPHKIFPFLVHLPATMLNIEVYAFLILSSDNY